MSVESIRV